MTVESADGEAWMLSKFIGSAGELPVIFDFLSTVKENELNNAYMERPIWLNKIIESVFIMVPVKNSVKEDSWNLKLFDIKNIKTLPDEIEVTFYKHTCFPICGRCHQ